MYLVLIKITILIAAVLASSFSLMVGNVILKTYPEPPHPREGTEVFVHLSCMLFIVFLYYWYKFSKRIIKYFKF